MTEPRDTAERLSPDDQATQAETQQRDGALAAARRAAASRQAQPGRCANCGAACLPQAVYCDEDCKADHEQRRRREARRGRAA